MMILESLVAQLEQRFQHEKRAQVCLWFDEKQEFGRILLALRTHLATRQHSPFMLLEYDAAALHGQVWLKHHVHQTISQTIDTDERHRLRFVLYLPFGEDRLDAANADEGVRLDLLEEYRTGGVLWRIGGKRPTLFSFLRQAGVVLPDSPSDQRRLYEGGKDSLLAKYAFRFVDRPAVFWATLLTPEIAQSRLIGDVDQTIFDMALDPQATWNALTEQGLDREFVGLVMERFGFDAPADAPEEWIEGLVAMLALTEAFLGYSEPPDFPFPDRLPPIPLRPNHRHILQRWLRDTEYRTAWDHWIGVVENNIDLSAWAKDRPGISFGFPHLTWQRLKRTYEAFEAASKKDSTIASFFEARGDAIAKETEFAKASPLGKGKWSLLRDLRVFIESCASGRKAVHSAQTAADLVRIYTERAGAIEWQHIVLRYGAEEEGHSSVARVADRAYADYAIALNNEFFQRVAVAGSLAGAGVQEVTQRLDQSLWKAIGKRAVIIVDALRYDCALALRQELRGHTVDVTPVLAALPTVTPIGMTALLPLSDFQVGLEIKGNNLHPKVNGKDTSVRDNRLALLTAFGAECRDIAEVETSSEPPSNLGELLVVFGHDEVDKMSSATKTDGRSSKHFEGRAQAKRGRGRIVG